MTNNVLRILARTACAGTSLAVPSIAGAVEFTQVSWYDSTLGWHQEYAPTWSPGADSIAAETNVLIGGGEYSIPYVHVWSVPQSGAHMHVNLNVKSPAWSPDGLGIAVAAVERPSGIWIYWRTNAPPTQLTDSGWEPAWHPNGVLVAYSVFASTQWDLWQVDRNTGTETQLTFDPFDETTPAWSPDGTKVAFVSNRTGNLEVWIRDTVQGSDRQLTSDPSADEHPAWSPSGRWIAFASTRSGSSDIWIEDLHGILPPTRITTDPAEDRDPEWSPDGASIAFSSNRSSSSWGFRIWIASDLGLPDSTVSTKPTTWSAWKDRHRR